MNLRSITVVIALALFALLSCKKKKTSEITPNVTVKPPSIDTSQNIPDVDVYLLGSALTKNSHNIAAYWKNGTPVKIKDSITDGSSYAQDMSIENNDVYLLGTMHRNGARSAYWKNGYEMAILDFSARKMAVNGNDVHIIGVRLVMNDFVGVYWKNGVAVDIENSSWVTDIVVKDNDVYIAGRYRAANGQEIGAYWKNGIMTAVPSSLGLHCLYFNGKDMYWGGQNEVAKAAYWKNGQIFNMPETPYTSAVTAISVTGNDVYCAGYWYRKETTLNSLCYWKNGVKTELMTEAQARAIDPNLRVIKDILLHGADLYIPGYIDAVPAYWKNDELFKYPSPEGRGYWSVKVFGH